MSLNAQMNQQFNQDLLDEFKKTIDYSGLIARPPVEKDVIIDWRNALLSITDSKGVVWTNKPKEPVLGLKGEAHFRFGLESCNGQAVVDVIFYPGDFQQRLDSLLSAAALTNRTSINYKINPNIDDVYLIPKDQAEIIFVSFLYGSFNIKISHWDNKDIAPLAEAIYQLMINNTVKSAREDKVIFNIVSDKQQYSVGSLIRIKLEGTAKNWNSEWAHKQAPILNSEYVEYVEKNDSFLVFKALKSGSVSIPFSAMNKKTLYVETKSVDIEII